MSLTVAQTLIWSHHVDGRMAVGEEIAHLTATNFWR
jgi:hypothetical protein